MLKKIIISILVVSVVGAGAAAAAYNYAEKPVTPAAAEEQVIAQEVLTSGQGNGYSGQTAGQAQDPNPLAEGLLGEPFEATGTIAAIDLNGIELNTDTGESIYVELGPQDYLTNQGIELATGETITVSGMVNEDLMYHAISLTRSTGEVIVLRTEDGQPMWSGGISNGNGNRSGSADGSHTPDPQAQVAPEDWVTLNGTLMELTRGQMTIQTESGELVSFQSGQPRFFDAEGVVFNAGDQVSVVGYYQETQFVAGDITNLTTGEKAMLRDPNGRPLWAGPGGNGNGGANMTTNDEGASN